MKVQFSGVRPRSAAWSGRVPAGTDGTWYLEASFTQASLTRRLPFHTPFWRNNWPNLAMSSVLSWRPQPPALMPCGLSSHSGTAMCSGSNRRGVR